MCLTEFDQAKYEESIRRESEAEGEAKGIEIGEARGIEIGEAKGKDEERIQSIKKMAFLLKKMGIFLDDSITKIKESYNDEDVSIIQQIVMDIYD